MMRSSVSTLQKANHAPPSIDANLLLNALTTAVIVVGPAQSVHQVNVAAEQLFESSRIHLCDRPLSELLPVNSPVFYLLHQALADGATVSEYGVILDTPRTGHRIVSITATPLLEKPGWVVVAINEHSIAIRMGQRFTHRHAARSVTAMAAILAHEIKNPLSGIRGAAQLLERNALPDDKPLTQLICEEADRIVALVNRMDVFSHRPLERKAVNIHRVLEHVRRVVENGFAQSVRFSEVYDPSLPPVLGNRDQLVQVFLNLVKNAAEAVAAKQGEIVLTTAYQNMVRLAVTATNTSIHLPLVISVQDNGPGIPEDLHRHLFDPFVTTKSNGSGLGLALVAKVINDHGGLIEFDTQPGWTVFRVMLPMANEGADTGL